MKGYIIRIKIENYDSDTFLYVDEEKKVRSICDEDGLIYCTEAEKWSDWDGHGSLEGKLEKGLYVGVINNNEIIKWNGHGLVGKVLNFKEVKIEEEAEKDPGIAGITRPVFKPRPKPWVGN